MGRGRDWKNSGRKKHVHSHLLVAEMIKIEPSEACMKLPTIPPHYSTVLFYKQVKPTENNIKDHSYNTRFKWEIAKSDRLVLNDKLPQSTGGLLFNNLFKTLKPLKILILRINWRNIWFTVPLIQFSGF